MNYGLVQALLYLASDKVRSFSSCADGIFSLSSAWLYMYVLDTSKPISTYCLLPSKKKKFFSASLWLALASVYRVHLIPS